MDDEWATDGFDEALASVAALVENEESPKLVIELSSEDNNYYDWNRNWESENLQNGLFSTASNPSLEEGKGGLVPGSQQGKLLSSEAISEHRQCESGHSWVSNKRSPNCKFLEFPKRIRRSSPTKENAACSGTRNISECSTKGNERRSLGELHIGNQHVHQENSQAEVSKAKGAVGRIPTNGILMWSYLGHYPADLKQLEPLESSTRNMAPEVIDTLTSCTFVHGLPTIADANHCKDSTSRDEVHEADHGERSHSSTSSTCSNICCVTPGSCVRLKSDAPPSTSHLVQVCYLHSVSLLYKVFSCRWKFGTSTRTRRILGTRMAVYSPSAVPRLETRKVSSLFNCCCSLWRRYHDGAPAQHVRRRPQDGIVDSIIQFL